MPPTKPPYPSEFRREAVQLTRTSERSIAQVARTLFRPASPVAPSAFANRQESVRTRAFLGAWLC
jgi:hypothetical protein